MSFVKFNTLPASQNYNVKDLECTYCLAEFQEGDHILSHAGTGNPHIFHKYCLGPYLAKNAECPTCKLVITHVNGKTIQQFREQEARKILENRASTQSLKTNLFAAIDRDRIGHVKIYLMNELPANLLYETLQFAAKREKIEALREILLKSLIPPDIKANALVETRNMQIVGILLEGDFPVSTRNRMLMQLIQREGTEQVVRAVLSKGAIPADDLGYLLVEAANGKKAEMLRILAPFGPASENLLRQALQNASRDENLPGETACVKALFESPSITDALKQEVLDGSWEITQQNDDGDDD